MCFIRIYLFLWLVVFSVVVNAVEYKEFTIPRTKVEVLQDPATKRSYEIHIQLPISYMANKKYPVVYMTDSPYTFPIAVGAARYPANVKKMEDLIYVGISWQNDVNPGYSRQRDYTPTIVTKGYKDPSANHETAFPTTAIQGLWWLFNSKDGVAI